MSIFSVNVCTRLIQYAPSWQTTENGNSSIYSAVDLNEVHFAGGRWWLVTPISVDFASLGIFIGFNYWLLYPHTSNKVCPHWLCVSVCTVEVGQHFCRFCKQCLWGCPGPYCTMAPLSDYYIHLQLPARPDQWCQLKEVTGKITEDATPPHQPRARRVSQCFE